MGGNRNRYSLNLQDYLVLTGLLHHILTAWIFLFLSDIPKQGGNKNKVDLSEQLRIVVYLLKR